MDEDSIVHVLKSLEATQRPESLYKHLQCLRSVVINKNRFTIVLKHGGIHNVLNCMFKNKKNVNIIDTALSILGNCCIERELAKEVIKKNGLQILSNVLSKWTQDSIICRTYRVIGNIAQFDNYASELYKYGVVSKIVGTLNKSISANDSGNEIGKNKSTAIKISMGTQVMAVRALRQMWESYSNRHNMIKDGVVRAVSMILIHYTEKWLHKSNTDPMRKPYEKLLENVLKCLLLFSKWGTLECAQQVLADGNGFKALVSLIDLNPYSAVKCLTNFSHCARSRSDIANAAAIERIVYKIKEHLDKNPDERCSNEIISAFCLFCKHPMNCSEVKKAGGLQIILEILKQCKSRRQEYQIVTALSGFHYDEQSQEILLSNGVVNIVIDCLERNLKSTHDLNEKHDYIKRRKRSKITLKLDENTCGKRIRDSSPINDISSSPSGSYVSDSYVYYKHCGRITPPDSSDSSPFGSPNCTPPRRNEYDMDEEDDDDSINYSPVCSDAEQEQDIDINLEKDSPLTLQTPEPESGQENDDDLDNEKMHFENSDMQEKAIIIMLVVLLRVSHVKPTSPEMSLGTKKNIVILLKYLRESRHPSGRVTTLLTRIFSNHDNLLQLITSDVVQLIHSLTDMQHNMNCSMCFRMDSIGHLLLKHLSNVAESNCGKAILFDILQSGSNEPKRKCVVNIPLIVRSKSMLQKIMDIWLGLSTLIKLFAENINLRYQISIAFHKLATTMNINNPVSGTNNISKNYFNLSESYELNSTVQNLVTIKLDDGSTVNTDRDFLINQTDYFKVMLTGSFKESNQEAIRLKNVSKNALQCLLNLLESNYQSVAPCKLNVRLVTILEVIVLTDIYLMEQLTDWLTRCVEQCMLKVDTACEIYNWSIVSGTNFLRIETVAFILTGKMKDGERCQLFESIVEYGLLDEIKDDVQELVLRYLKIH